MNDATFRLEVRLALARRRAVATDPATRDSLRLVARAWNLAGIDERLEVPTLGGRGGLDDAPSESFR